MAKRNRHEFFDEGFLARLERLHLAGKHVAARERGGSRRSRRVGDGLEFADHRAYAPGDDVRFIDWPYYARMEKLLLRLFHEHSESEVGILLDASGSMAPAGSREKFHYALRAAAALTFVAMGGLERVVIVPFAEELGEPLRTGRNRAQIFDVLDFLGGLTPGGRTRLEHCAGQFARKHPRPGTLLVLSDLLDCGQELSDALARLRQTGGDVTVLHLYSPADAAPIETGPVLLEQAETGERISLHVTDEILAEVRRGWERFQGGCHRACLARGAAYVPAGTDAPFERMVLTSLRRAGVLAG